MNSGKQGRRNHGRRRQGKARRSVPLIAHPAFAPLIGLWGALLGGLPVMVLPPALVAEATRGTMLGLYGDSAQLLLAAMGAVLLGPAIYFAARMKWDRLRRDAYRPSIVEAAARQLRPINPRRDLGTQSIDDPIETMPFASPAWRDAAVERDEHGKERVPTGEPNPSPRELDLSEFAALPGRDGVWVAEPGLAESAGEPARPAAPVTELRPAAPPSPEPGTAALARLRAVPASELSLAEMVERFAGALHEHRAAPSPRALDPADLASREAALADALKALTALSVERAASGPAAERDAPLRAALAQLHARRGAA